MYCQILEEVGSFFMVSRGRLHGPRLGRGRKPSQGLDLVLRWANDLVWCEYR